jgi:ribonuclease HII
VPVKTVIKGDSLSANIAAASVLANVARDDVMMELAQKYPQYGFEINILQATYLAMERAINGLSIRPDIALIDGNRAKDFGVPVKTVIKGDSLSANIAAASVLAKVARDDVMMELAQKYPQYGFEIHKGYGTKAHYEALRAHGHCAVHRLSFLKKFYGND